MKFRTAFIALFLMITATGCVKEAVEQKKVSEQPQSVPAKVVDTTPVTLKFAVHLPINDEFKQLYIEPVTKKYPYITLELMNVNTFKQYDQLIAAGELQVIEVLTSDEVQTNVSKAGRISPLNSEAVQKVFGQNDPSLKNKNVTGIVKSKPVKYPIYLYREIAEPLTIKKFDDLLKGSKDVNASLRELDEEINQAVQIEKK